MHPPPPLCVCFSESGFGSRICMFIMSAVDNVWCWVSPGQPVGNVGLWICYVPGEFGMENASDAIAMYVLDILLLKCVEVG